MTSPSDHKRQAAIKALINIALFEGAVLVVVVGVYLYTNNLTYLVGGVVGSTLIFGPMFVRWFKQHGEALNTKSGEHGHG